MAVWEDGVSLSQMQCRLHVQEDAEDPYEVRLREGAQVQVPLLQQEGQVLIEYLQAHQNAAQRKTGVRGQIRVVSFFYLFLP